MPIRPMLAGRKATWEQIAAGRDRYIGGLLIDVGDHMQITPDLGLMQGLRTRIRDVRLDGLFFEAEGEAFSCGGTLRHLTVIGQSRFGPGLELSGYAGHEWHMLEKESYH